MPRPPERFLPDPKARLREQFHEVCRFKHLSPRTEETYWGWVRRYLRFHKQGDVWRHLRDLGAAELQRFLGHLASEGQVGASTQNQALTGVRRAQPVGWVSGQRGKGEEGLFRSTLFWSSARICVICGQIGALQSGRGLPQGSVVRGPWSVVNGRKAEV